MRKNSIYIIALLIPAAVLSAAILSPTFQKPPTIFSAPTLKGIAEKLSKKAEIPIEIQVYGSVFAANIIKSGRTPDLFLSVDGELKHGLPYRSEKVLGTYQLMLICTNRYGDLEALKTAKIGLADPNQAPIGYRALAAIYLISTNEGLEILDEVEKSLNVRFVKDSKHLTLLAADISASGRFYIRPNQDAVYSLLEAEVVDCIFAYEPFVIYRRLTNIYNIIELPKYARFEDDPPIEITAKLKTGEVKVVRFEAVALSFTEFGDKLLLLLDRINVENFGVKPLR